MEVTYDQIAELLVSAKIQNRYIHCQFRLPGVDRTITADSPVVRRDNTQNRMVETVKRNILWEARRLAYQAVREALGPGFLGRTGEQIVNTVLRENAVLDTFSEADKKAAIVAAFQKVADQYVFDTATQSWRAAQLSSPLEKQLAGAPVTHPYDREILARMLMELARANATVSAEEEAFLQEQLDLTPLQYQELALTDPVSGIEAEEVSPEAKATIFQLLYTIALVDQRLHEREKKLLDYYGQSMGLSPEEQARLATSAKVSLLESVLEMGVAREKLFELADQLALDHAEVERIYVRYRKRHMDSQA